MLIWFAAFLLQSNEAPFQQAAQALARGDNATAERQLQIVLRGAPSHIGALGNLGIVYARTGRAPEAVAVYQRALKLAPDQPGLLLNLGLAQLQLEDYTAAKVVLQRIGRRGTPSAQVSELLATAQLFTGEVEPALATLEALNRDDPERAGVLYLLALAYLKKNDHPSAGLAFDNLMKVLSPDKAHYLAGKAYYETSNFEDAERELRLAGNAPLELGKTYLSLRRPEDAVRELRLALQRQPAEVDAQYHLGALLVQDSATEAEGERLLEEVRRRRPDSWGAHYYLGKLRLAQKRPREAVTLLEAAARLHASEPAVLFQLAQAYRQTNRPVEARRAAERVAALKQAANEPLVLK